MSERIQKLKLAKNILVKKLSPVSGFVNFFDKK